MSLNCRSITPEAWAQAREALIFFFSRRHGSDQAQDLAQDTLVALWNREDYLFEKEEDFLRVCLGFGRMVSQAGYRHARRDLEHLVATREANASHPFPGGANAAENRVLLEQICNLGESRLLEQDWKLVIQSARGDAPPDQLSPAQKNKLRVRLHRARKKLEEITGWGR